MTRTACWPTHGWVPADAAAGSPAIDAELDTPLAGPLDLYDAPRRQGRAIDIGAVEHSAGR
jgi:hypothetical protein